MLMRGGHIQTILPALTRKPVLPKPYQRERLTTPDGDFLDLDWMKCGSNTLVVICHGLEGSSHSPYASGMARAMYLAGWDVLAWNYRSCSGEINLGLRMYHSGATGDLTRVIEHAHAPYDDILLVGFSLGGNLMLKYLGEAKPHASIRKAVAISAPLDLYGSCQQLNQGLNWIYSNRFLKSLLKKAHLKHAQYPDQVDIGKLKKIKRVMDFDEWFTAPLHGFEGAKDYYQKCSSLFFLETIQTPTWIISALNDPMLSERCTDPSVAAPNAHLTYIVSQEGGHCGFPSLTKKVWWHEEQAVRVLGGVV